MGYYFMFDLLAFAEDQKRYKKALNVLKSAAGHIFVNSFWVLILAFY